MLLMVPPLYFKGMYHHHRLSPLPEDYLQKVALALAVIVGQVDYWLLDLAVQGVLTPHQDPHKFDGSTAYEQDSITHPNLSDACLVPAQTFMISDES